MSTPNSSAPAQSTPASPSPASAAVKDAGTAQQTAAPQAKPTEAQIRKLKLQLEGQEIEMPESEVIALAQQGKVANKRFQEAAQMRKEAEAFAQMLKSNPREALAKFGIDVRKFSEETLMEMLQQEQMTPEQKKAAANEKRLREFEEKEKAAKEAETQRQMKELEDKHLADYNKLFAEALSASGLPKTSYTVKRMAELQLVNVKKGLNLDANQLAKLVREDYIAEQKALFSSADGDALMELLGDDAVKKLSKAQIKKLKTASPSFSKPAREPEAKSGSPRMSWREFQKKNRGT